MLYNYTAYVFDEIRIIFEPLTIAIFQLCLLPKMRLSVDLEGRYTGYKCLYKTRLKDPGIGKTKSHKITKKRPNSRLYLSEPLTMILVRMVESLIESKVEIERANSRLMNKEELSAWLPLPILGTSQTPIWIGKWFLPMFWKLKHRIMVCLSNRPLCWSMLTLQVRP